ncbi:hypothetical protein [Coxiella burnetii]|uniref:Uncharacterized protein n=1 Tax=Coxiella burnetii (strain Dugway 5J108-111) TaxID=434922 RepID=A9KD56_COXBN|nr:hypothetical protein [Coxiella burnetii]ABS77890.2 hypothetical protein CBUD_1883 [Coxiella burnetii Dugway 5J108-111]ACJ19690.1 hypothetical protein CbuK_0402 [Coxiella burnetii CbuK_Q154]ATN85507.1 hypothetical protein AYO29_02905 [Coxiella burnetii str. Schperling]EAX32813.3 hypothetical protein A35_02010 [Coxiella burnetii 'MSU Goat Q177']OYK79375.1 hypothetical protein CbuD7E6568_09715 [Coxiella burnetii]
MNLFISLFCCCCCSLDPVRHDPVVLAASNLFCNKKNDTADEEAYLLEEGLSR